MFILNGKPLISGAQVTVGDVVYPFSFISSATPEERAALGITEAPDPVRPDDRFYIVTLSADGLSYSKTPKDLTELKDFWKSSINSTAGSLLSGSDWMVVRQVESSVPVPADWATFRSDVRAYANKVGADIAAAATIEDFVAVVTGVTWPVDPATLAMRAKLQAAA